MTSYLTLCPLSRVAAAALAACSLVGCNALQERQNIATEAQTDVSTVSAKLEDVRTNDAREAAIGREFDGAWLGGKTVKVARKAQLPAALRTPIRYSFSDSPSLLLHAERRRKIIGLPVRVTPAALVARGMAAGSSDLNAGTQAGTAKRTALNGLPAPLAQVVPGSSEQPRSGSYIIDKMSVVGGTYVPIDLLDRISAGFGVGWDFNERDNSVTISRLVTRTYTVATVLNTQTTTTNITKRASTGENSSAGNGSTAQVGSATSSSDVTAKSEATIDVIKNIKAALESTVTPSVGKFAVSTSGIVTVTDTREVHDQVSALIDAENKALGRQVRVRMQVVEITANDTNTLGVDWSWAITNAASKWAGGVY